MGIPSDSSAKEKLAATHSSDRFATVDEQGHLILPESVTHQFGLVPGKLVYFDVAENTIRLHRPLSSLAKIYIEPTTRCNMDCEMCQRRAWSDGPVDMTPETFARILEAIEACHPRPKVVLGGFGEPLMHSHVMEFIGQCKNLGAAVELITNGLLLSADRVRTLRSLELDRLWLSVDGRTEKCYGHSMNQEALAKLTRTIGGFKTIRHSPLDCRPRLGLVFVAMKNNIQELPNVIDLARQLHADKVLVSNLLPYAPEMSEEILYGRSLWCMDNGHFQIRLPRMDTGGRIVEFLSQALEYRNVMDILDREYEDSFNTCPFVKAGSVSIRSDGGVSPCLPLLHPHVSVKGDVQRQNRECLFGSLRDQGLLEIWNSPVYVDFRKRVTQFDFPPCVSCGTCELAGSNAEDCFGNPFPTCGGCLWAQGLILCP